MKNRSPKLGFLDRGGDEEQDYFDSLIRVATNEYKPSVQGSNVHGSLVRTRIMRGGLGSGKTRCAGEHVNTLALTYPNSLHFIGRRDITSLKVTTQKEFLECVIRPETIITFNVNDNILYYKNGSQILFRETKDISKAKSLQLTSYFLDEADENESEEVWDFLDQRLRQKWPTGQTDADGKPIFLVPPYAGLLVFNPVSDDHWLYHLAQRKDTDVQDFRFDTEDNRHNLPPGYIEGLKARLAPWDIDRLIHGHWGRNIKGKPVYHGFKKDTHVKVLQVRQDLPVLRGWDFGYGHPAVRWAQFDPATGRYFILREYLGSQIHLHDVVKVVRKITDELCGPNYPIFDYGDPHGADKKDVGQSSIEYLRIHHHIFVNSKRDRIRTGMDELQEKILQLGPVVEGSEKQEPLFLVDHSCKVTIDAYLGGYHRDDAGEAVKDGYYDHLCDTDRYVIVHNMNKHLAHKMRLKKRHIPRSLYTGY